MNVFITGGTGFIGAHIVKTLSGAGHRITVLTRNLQKATGLLDLAGITFAPGDLSDFEGVAAALPGHDAVIHVALHWGAGAANMLLNDSLSAVKLFETAADLGVKSIIHTSSTSVNDWIYTDETALREGAAHSVFETSKPNPVTYYGATKGAVELYLNAIAFQRKIRANVIRPGYTFGNPAVEAATSQADTRFMSIARAARDGKPIDVVKNDGTQFIAAEDLAKIYLAVLESDVRNRTFFGLGATFISWEEVARIAIKLFSSKSEIIVEDKGRPDAAALFDVSGIETEFGFKFECREKIALHLKFLAEN